MSRIAHAVSAAALALTAPAIGLAAPAGRPVPVSITASPGEADSVVRALGASALRVTRRNGRHLQVTAAPRRIGALRAIPGVAAAFAASASMPETDPDDPGAAVAGSSGRVISEGFERVGADALQSLALDGRGVVIAILDLGFGTSRIPSLQAARELPPPSRLGTRSFDTTWGLAGRNAYGNATNHGELVAQTVYDFAPAARYLFVNYHTEQDFQAAVDWLVQHPPDIVVHSNSFLEGPFDGTGPAAQAVDRAAAAGITWVNSAGNYANRHWEGQWADADSDDVLDWPVNPGWTFTRGPGQPITFALSWEQEEGVEVSDLDLVLDKRAPSGEWVEMVASRDRQVEGARPAERFTGYSSGDGGEFRLRVVLASGPPPGGRLTLFTREGTLSDIGDPVPSSAPTPGDADGSITVGAVDWSNNALKSYSSNGPTDDGRMKPDIVAPTNTRVLTATGPRAIGGTSNSAPNAAGAIALMMAARRQAGAPLDPGGVRDLLADDALDLGTAGPDNSFGAGRVRVDTDPPEIQVPVLRRRVVTTLPVRIRASVDDASRVSSWVVTVDGRMAGGRRGESARGASLGRRWLPDGRHLIEVRATDWPGNVGTRRFPVFVDSRAPRIRVFRVERVGAATASAGASGRRRARAVLGIADVGPARVVVTLTKRRRVVIRRVIRFTRSSRRVIPLGVLAPGRYVAVIIARDRVGHVRRATRVIRLGR